MFFHSMLDVGSSMLDVHLFIQAQRSSNEVLLKAEGRSSSEALL
jgi:hypothetical protein